MLPSVLANELRDAVAAFLRQAFPFANSYFQRSEDGQESPTALIDGLIDTPARLFKGPYLDIKLPFRFAESSDLPFRHVKLSYTPYQHQLRAFERLVGEQPRSTIIATGTGSGKTECFLLPVLDDCVNRREQGIKTIVVYPMNALANDQAQRFAREVAKLEPKLTVGLYVGDEPKNAPTTMGPENVISSQETLRQNPPDVLLTNYKMLDFLLIRPKDQPLWRFNKPGMLRYLVVDELHTFDGAQGTDLGCLIRRLRDRLGAGDEVACVGTSATMGLESKSQLVQYAADVFAADFDESAIIEEDRLSAEEYLNSAMVGDDEKPPGGLEFFNWPDRDEARLDPSRYGRAEEYLFHQARVWFADLPADELPRLNAPQPYRRAQANVRLGALLHQHSAFHELIRASERVQGFPDLVAEWQAVRSLSSRAQAERILTSLISLVSAARRWNKKDSDDPEDWTQPLLDVRQQVWLRELRRLVCSVPEDDSPARIAFFDDLKNPEQPLHLPLLHCRECHLGAWGAVARKGSNAINPDLQRFYEAWFSYSLNTRLIVPLATDEEPEDHVQYFCPKCQRLQSGNGEARCPGCEEKTLRRVWVPEMIRTVNRGSDERLQAHHDCPDCGARETLAIVGYRAATLTSVMSGRLFNSPYNDDWKLIAFSDSVQDAAHRSGFLEANTWRQVLRQAMARWLRTQPPGISLAEMSELLPSYWRDQSDDAHFAALFMPPNLAWHPHYRALNEGEADDLPAGSELPDMVRKRLSWECLAEFGVRSQIGRSLERTGVAAIGFDTNKLKQDITTLAERLREEIGTLRDIEDERFHQFVVGWLYRMRTLGAVEHEALQGYLAHGGKEYIINRMVPWMPNYGRSRRPPGAITLRHVSNNFEAMILTRQDTWSVRWLKKTLGEESVFAANEAQQVFKLMLDHLTRQDWLQEHFREGQRGQERSLWMINPGCLLVDREVATLRCDTCRHAVPVSRAVADHYVEIPCLRPTCHGRLAPGPRSDGAAEYGVTEPRRIVPHEHTGLLARSDRERVERSFIHGREPWHVNLLSATPTLEMGIDIGALSSVFLCSVPPTQANYIQRIGRAGRRDGNALAVTIANGRNHDLYFYEEPREMISGSVQTPGVFLKAIAVLERQLIAYCFDRWAASGIDESAIPGQLRRALDAVEQSYQDRFPYNLIQFVEANQHELLTGFIGMFEELQGDEQAKAYLHSFIHEAGHRSLSWRILNRLQELVQERASLLKKTKDLKKTLDILEAKPQDDATKEEIEQVRRERNALLSLVNGRNTQATLNFFTDEGLLPNYAFPEEGVTLQSVILRRLGPGEHSDDGKSYEKTSYTLQRPATAALSELAPESRFYAVSHEMEIDQVDLDLTRVEEWRFCDRCQHSERVDIQDRHSACPRCGSAQWADSGQKQSVLRLRQVYSTVDTRANRIGDESEQRVPAFYNRQMLVDIEQEAKRQGFRLKSDTLPFGFEFVDNVTLREVNFGPSGDDSKVFSVAGKELGRNGFKICKQCGKVQKARRRPRDEPHAYSCPLRANPDQATDEDFHQSLYLYRELDSEAIRILLPLSEVAYSDEKLHSFISALNLGLKAYFRGDVDHLQVTDMREPPSEGSAERIYLVIYDRIPGGTGYLKELMTEPKKLFDVLEKAHERLATCPCIDDEEKDGCYRCILAYRDSRNMPTISRHSAEQLLREILERRDQIETIESLGEINTNTLIESKLEQRFIDALGTLAGAEMGPKLLNGKNGWLLTLPGTDGRPTGWLVEHQVKVGPDQGVALNTEIDVLLTPARAEDAARYRPIAVYLDGLQYHHNQVDDDVCKRSALLLSGRYWVYSLNWDDLPEKGHIAKSHNLDMMRHENRSHQKMVDWFNQMAEKASWDLAAEHAAQHGHGTFDWLHKLLREPDAAELRFHQRAVYRGWTALAPHVARDASVRENLSVAAGDQAPGPVLNELAFTDEDCVPGGFAEALGYDAAGVELLVSLPKAAVESKALATIAESLRLHLCFDDRDTEPTEEFKTAWRAFWHAANQLQFCAGFSMASRRAVSSGQLDKVWETAKSIQSQAEQAEAALAAGSASWSEAEEYSTLAPEQLAALKAVGLPAPEVGVDLMGEDGAVALGGELVELAWPDEKIAVVLEEPAQTLPGWRLVLADDAAVAKLKQVLEQGVA